jgi:lipopolysaccharide export system protein LptC
MRALRQPAGANGGPAQLLRRLLPALPAPGDGYSRRVALLKRVLPGVGVALVLLVAAWPRVNAVFDSVRFRLPAIDLREARELKMVKPSYAGVDRQNRPFVVTAAIGRQTPDRDDLLSLEAPEATLHPRPERTIVLTAASAIYQSQAQLLDLFDNVNLVRDDGTRFVTRSAHVDLAQNTAEGREPIVGHGPAGDLTAQGFRVLQKGDAILFDGKSDLLLRGSRPGAVPARRPAALPADVAAAAARVEAAALAQPARPAAPPARPAR